MNLKVHLIFPGTCEDALNFYKEVLNGKVDFIFRKKEDKSTLIADADREKISHMVIKTPFFELAGEDADPDQPVIAGNNNKLVLKFDDLPLCKQVFSRFAEKGTVTMPLTKTLFCEAMGEVTDCFGIHWIIMMNDDNYQG